MQEKLYTVQLKSEMRIYRITDFEQGRRSDLEVTMLTDPAPPKPQSYFQPPPPEAFGRK